MIGGKYAKVNRNHLPLFLQQFALRIVRCWSGESKRPTLTVAGTVDAAAAVVAVAVYFQRQLQRSWPQEHGSLSPNPRGS